jgi:hypothetical protein
MEFYLDKYTINLTKLKSEDETTIKFINQVYYDMMGVYRDYCLGSYTNKSTENLMIAYFNTLYYNGFLIDIRDQKLEEILK